MLIKKFIAVVLFTISFPVLGQELTEAELISNLLNSTVKIATYSESGPSSSGSGVIVSNKGLILTNYHVVHRSKRIKIWVYENQDGRYYDGFILAVDPAADLALLYANLEENDNHHVSQFEDMEGIIFPGKSVIAVGHPLGLDWTVSRGTINALNRPSFITPYINLIQHDATINQGSSGGPLFNERGNLIGINTYIIAPPESGIPVYSGFGYAVQGDDVQASLLRMATVGDVQGFRPAFKINILDLNDDLETEIKNETPATYVPNTFGLLVADLNPGDYGFEQGLRNFDVIVSVDGYPVNNIADLAMFLKAAQKFPGDEVYLLVNREKKFILLTYTLSEIDVPIELYDRERPGRNEENDS